MMAGSYTWTCYRCGVIDRPGDALSYHRHMEGEHPGPLPFDGCNCDACCDADEVQP